MEDLHQSHAHPEDTFAELVVEPAPKANFTRRLGDSVVFLAYSILFTTNIGVSNLSLQMVSLPLHQIVRSTNPAVTLVLEWVLLGKMVKSNLTLISLLMVILGVAMTTLGEYDFSGPGLVLTLIGVFLSSLKGVVTNVLLAGPFDYKPVDLLHRMSGLSAIQCLLISIGSGEMAACIAFLGQVDRPLVHGVSDGDSDLRVYAAFEGGMSSPDTTVREAGVGSIAEASESHAGLRAVILALTVNGLMAFAMNLVSFSANRKLGALSMTVAGNVKQSLTIAISVWLLDFVITGANGAGDPVRLQVNTLTAERSKSLLPYDFYYPAFHFCKPDVMRPQSESLGSILFGDRLYNSKFAMNMLSNTTCNSLCGVQTIPAADAQFINAKIKEEYWMNWLVDGLPVARRYVATDSSEIFSLGFPIGAIHESSQLPLFYNHYDLELEYHATGKVNSAKQKLYRVVGAHVYPLSVSMLDRNAASCQYTGGEFTPLTLDPTADNSVDFTYNVRWIESATTWGTRWDKYLKITAPQIHWFSIVNSIVIVVMLTSVVAMILVRTLHLDISRYNRLAGGAHAENENGVIEEDESGWKLLHADVFRPPRYRLLLSVFVGSGCQLVLLSFVTLFLALLGFFSPSSRGSLLTVAFVCYLLFSGVAGNVSAGLYKMMGGCYWYHAALVAATIIPMYVKCLIL
ncbi:hypothetical protein HK101_009693 [Irineochytrium annulatum]|nr:hypothetical protein HK101_009693 [Irineochytrium annulatum]